MLRFKEGFEDTEIHIPGKRLIINRYNLNDPQVQSLLKKFPRYAHNFEEVKDEGTGKLSVQSSSLIEEEPETSTGSMSIVGEEPIVDDVQSSSLIEEEPETSTGSMSIVGEEPIVDKPVTKQTSKKSSSSKVKGQGKNKR